MAVDGGAAVVATDPKGFARTQWQTWSPSGWFDDRTFDSVAHSFENPDWTAITVNSYRGRWRPEPGDSRYDPLRATIAKTESLRVPTLLIHGREDTCVLPVSTAGMERCFTAGYRRALLEGVGHFPTREAPDRVAALIIEHLSQSAAERQR
jgi:pimeloyl-ACP methyl ester carboxylesterase